MTNTQITVMAITGMTSTCVGAMLTGYSLYKIMSLSEESSYNKLSYEESEQIYLAGLGLMVGVSGMYLGANMLGTSINASNKMCYNKGVNDTLKAVNMGLINAKPKHHRPCMCGRYSWNEQPKPVETQAPAPAPVEPAPVDASVTITTF